MEEMTAKIMDRSLIIGGIFLALAILGGIYRFLHLGFYSMGMEKSHAGIAAGALMVVAGAFIYHRFF